MAHVPDLAAGPEVDGLGLYRRMLFVRRFEEQVDELCGAAKMPGLAHLHIGQEAVAVGVCAALRDEDLITSTHRGHGHCLAKGAAVSLMFAELLGKRSCYNHGKAGSMRIAGQRAEQPGCERHRRQQRADRDGRRAHGPEEGKRPDHLDAAQERAATEVPGGAPSTTSTRPPSAWARCVTMPFSPGREDQTVPTPDSVAQRAGDLMGSRL